MSEKGIYGCFGKWLAFIECLQKWARSWPILHFIPMTFPLAHFLSIYILSKAVDSFIWPSDSLAEMMTMTMMVMMMRLIIITTFWEQDCSWFLCFGKTLRNAVCLIDAQSLFNESWQRMPDRVRPWIISPWNFSSNNGTKGRLVLGHDNSAKKNYSVFDWLGTF